MHSKRRNLFPISCFILLIIFIQQSCSSTTTFNETAYGQAVKLKVASLELMQKAADSFSLHSGEVDTLKHDLKVAYEYSRGRPGNEITTKQWEIMINADRNLIGGFLRIWEEDGVLSPAFISEAQSVIGSAFDTIIGLESGKIKSSDLPEVQPDINKEN